MDAIAYEQIIANREAENARLAEHLQEARATIARLQRRVAELEATVAEMADDASSGRPVHKHWSTSDPPPTASAGR